MNKNSITLSGFTLPYEELPFFPNATIGTTDSKGVTELTTGEYTFYLSNTSLKYRKKVKGSGAASPMKDIKAFSELTELGFSVNGSAPALEEENVNMAQKINFEGAQHPVPKAVETLMRKSGITADVIELADLDLALSKHTGKDLDTLVAFEDELSKLQDPGQGAGDQAPTGDGAAGDEAPAGDEGDKAPAGDGGQAPAGDEGDKKPEDDKKTLGGGPLGGSNVFNSNSNRAPRTPRKEKTEAEKEADKQKREMDRQNTLDTIKTTNGEIDDLRKKNQSHEMAETALKSLRSLVLIDGVLPTFATYVASDTRIRGEVRNKVKPEDRVWHTSLKGKTGNTATGKDIAAKYAQGDYDVNLRESNPSPITGFFLFLPDSLKGFTPSRLSQVSERERVVDAAAKADAKRVIVYMSRQEVITLLVSIGGYIGFYNATGTRPVLTANTIHLHSKTDAETEVTEYSLRAQTPAGKNTKVSVRQFVPMTTHNIVKMGDPKFDAKITTKALFHRLLMDVPKGAPANKFSQLSQQGKTQFQLDTDGSLVFNGFQDTFSVPAYDNVGDSNRTVNMGLPLVVMTEPTTAGAVAKPKFSKSKYNDSGYSSEHKGNLGIVVDQLKAIKRVTNKSQLNSNQEELNRLKGINSLLEGDSLVIK